MKQPHDSPPPTSSLRRILVRHGKLVAILAVLGGAVALALSLAQEPVYEARSSLSVRDINADLSLVGISAAASLTPAQLAAANAQAVTRVDTLERVRRRLNTRLTAADLLRAVTVTVNTKSNLIEIQARSDRAAFAAQLANTMARTAVSNANAQVRTRFRRSADELRGRLRTLGSGRANETTRIILSEQASRLQTLSVVAEPATLADIARPPTSPVSPKPVFNTALGSVFGFMLGLGAAFALLASDRRIQAPTDIADETDLPLLALVRDEVLGSLPFNIETPTVEQHRALAGFGIVRRKVQLTDLAKAPTTIAVVSGAAEEGKSTVAASLAAAFASVGSRTLLLECDLRRPTLMSRYDLPAVPGLSEFLEGNAQPEEILRVLPAPTGRDNGSSVSLICIPAGLPKSGPDDLLASSQFKEFLAEVSAVYDTVIVDTPPLLQVSDTLEILPLVDTLVLCVRIGSTTRAQLAETLRTLEPLSVDAAGIVVTGVSERDEIHLGYAYGYAYDDPRRAVPT